MAGIFVRRERRQVHSVRPAAAKAHVGLGACALNQPLAMCEGSVRSRERPGEHHCRTERADSLCPGSKKCDACMCAERDPVAC